MSRTETTTGESAQAIDTVTEVTPEQFDARCAELAAESAAVVAAAMAINARPARLIDRANDLSAFCSVAANRLVLQGIHFRAQDTEACDGRILIRVPYAALPASEYPPINGNTDETQLKDCIIPAKAVSEAIKSAEKHGTSLPVLGYVHVSSNCTKAHLATTDLDSERVISPKLIDLDYPKTDLVVPTDPPKVVINLAAGYLKKIADYVLKNCEKSDSVRLEIIDELSPVRFVVSLDDGRKVNGVLMPMRLS